ncbi:MAG TPA: DUF1565 domain-containing protein, partial [Thermomicrobiales bacterium]|nr:DUF1565 domain-containing protein [Thermomicrobiales bacterium]
LPLWGTYANPRAFYGSALLLDAGTTYEIRVSLNDPDGVNGNFTVTGSIATRGEDIAGASQLKPTQFVSSQGNDANNGTSPSSAWKTLEKAFNSAPAGAVVSVAPGSYAPPTTNRTLPITLVAENPAVDDGQNIINAGKHSVIEPQTITERNSGAWTNVKLKGPATGQTYSVWKWAGSPVANATVLAWSNSRTDEPQRVGYWNRRDGTFDGYSMETPEGWSEVLYRNETYNFGFASFGNDVYLRLPGDKNPNDVVMTLHDTWKSNDTGRLVLSGSNVRLSGFELRLVDAMLRSPSVNGVIDHNLFYMGTVYYKGDKGTPSSYPTNQVVQYNRMIDTSIRPRDGGTGVIPWLFVKQNLKLNGKETNWRRTGEAAEQHAIEGRGGANQLVVRHNTIEGYFNGVGANSTDFDRYSKAGADIYDNAFSHIADDTIEPEGDTINWRVWSNRIEYASVAMSTGPVDFGPIYFFRNEIWMLGNQGVGPDRSGDSGVGSYAFKYSGSSNPLARIYVVHNTFWTDKAGTNGGLQAAGGGSDTERFYLRNNIFRVTRYAFDSPGSGGGWNEDYDFFFTSDTGRGINYGTRNYKTVSEYRKVSGQGAHTNLSDKTDRFKAEPGLVDPARGNLDLANGSAQIDAGVVVPNISDQAGVDYNGAAPDLGANER